MYRRLYKRPTPKDTLETNSNVSGNVLLHSSIRHAPSSTSTISAPHLRFPHTRSADWIFRTAASSGSSVRTPINCRQSVDEFYVPTRHEALAGTPYFRNVQSHHKNSVTKYYGCIKFSRRQLPSIELRQPVARLDRADADGLTRPQACVFTTTHQYDAPTHVDDSYTYRLRTRHKCIM
jgi:hypothetical protein